MSDFCTTRSISISPDAKFLLLDTGEALTRPGRVIVGGRLSLLSAGCLDTTNDACSVVRIRSISGVSSPRFRDDSRGFVFFGNDQRGGERYTFSASILQDGPTLDVQLQNAVTELPRGVVTPIHRGSSDRDAAAVVDEAAEVTAGIRNAAGKIVRSYWNHDGYVGSILLGQVDEPVLIARPDGTVDPTAALAAFVPDGELLETADGVLEFVAQGYREPVGDHAYAVPANSKPIIESSRGVSIGYFTPRHVSTGGSLSPVEQVANRFLEDRPDIQLVAVSVNRAAGVLVGIGKSITDDAVVFEIDAASLKLRERLVSCGSPPEAAPVSVRISEMMWGDARHPLPVTLYDAPNSDRAVVFLHGGPGANGHGVNMSARVVDYLDHGFSVFVPSPSASVGGGLQLASRISELGVEAQRRDAAAISEGIRAARARYSLVGIHAESFGGSLLTNPNLAGQDFTVAIAPYLVHRDPATWTVDALSPARLDQQRRYEKAYLGEGEYSQSLEKQLSEWTPRSPLIAVYAARDDYSPVSDFGNIGLSEGIRVLVVPGTNHSSVFQDPLTMPSIFGFLDELLPTAPPIETRP